MAELEGTVLMDAETFLNVAPPSSSLRTVTVIFEFAAAATQQFSAPLDGYLLRVQSSKTSITVSVNNMPPSQAPNGATTRIVNGFAWSNGMDTLSSGFEMREKFNAGDLIYCRSAASAVVSVVLGFPEV